MQQIQREAAFFTAIDGKRTGLIILRPEGAIPDPVGGQALLYGRERLDRLQPGNDSGRSSSRTPGGRQGLLTPLPQAWTPPAPHRSIPQ
jgi:hypothetical protein